MGLIQEFLVWPRVMAFEAEMALQPSADVVIEEAVRIVAVGDDEAGGTDRVGNVEITRVVEWSARPGSRPRTSTSS
nr:hypothetical protein StreXyl84_67370 [Streptomyces sp. Xyl84]